MTRLLGVSVEHRVTSVSHHGGRELGVVPGSARTRELTTFVPDEDDDPNLGVVVTLTHDRFGSVWSAWQT